MSGAAALLLLLLIKVQLSSVCQLVDRAKIG